MVGMERSSQAVARTIEIVGSVFAVLLGLKNFTTEMRRTKTLLQVSEEGDQSP